MTSEQERLDAILEARARALAAPRVDHEREGARLLLLVFVVARERYALETRRLHAVVPRARWTRLPGAPPELLGLTAFRGEPLAVFDLRPLLGVEQPTGGQVAVVLGEHAPELALAADEVEGVARVRVEELRPAPPGAGGLARLPTFGVLEDGTAVLDAARLLRDPRLVVEDEPEPPRGSR